MSLPTRQQLENFRANAEHDEMVAIMNGFEQSGDRRNGPVWDLINKWDEQLKEIGQ